MTSSSVLKLDNTRSDDPFYLDPEYMPLYRTHNISSDEQVLLARAIMQSIERFGGKGPNVIDIGCADAVLTRRFARLFESITIFEPNKILFSHAVSKLSREKIELHEYNEAFPPRTHALPDDFDTAIASHVLYHVDKQYWPSFFNSISRALRMRGLCIVTLWNEESQIRKFLRSVTPDRQIACSAEELVTEEEDRLFELGLEIVRVEPIEPIIKAHSQPAAADIFKFLLGSRRRASGADAQLTAEFEKRITAEGLKNSQSIVTMRKR
jgi:SAM-dependent methyltransferase